jgi:hypothetical protein
MEPVEIRLLNYCFRFKQLRWREEFSMTFPPKKDPARVHLAYALVEISGLKVTSVEEATKVLDSLPPAIISRVYRIYRGSLPAPRKFFTAKLYKAPSTSVYTKRVDEEKTEVEDIVHDPALAEMEAKYGLQEVEEARALSQRIVAASGLRGASKASDDGN